MVYRTLAVLLLGAFLPPVTAAPEITVRGNSTDITTGDITPISSDHTYFGSLMASLSRTFTVRNDGTTIMTVSGISLSGTNAAEFALTGVPTTVASGASATFTVTFTPSATGTGSRNATVTIASNDADEASFTFAIRAGYCPGTRLYVDGNLSSTGNGTSWASGYQSLAAALKVAQECPGVGEVYVAQGTYLPVYKPFSLNSDKVGIEETTYDAQQLTFHLRTGLKVYGGYPNGGGTRSVTANVTTLSGDLGVSGTTSDNAAHVVMMDSATVWAATNDTTLIDGFTITKAYNPYTYTSVTLNGHSYYASYGGGIYVHNGTHVIHNNIITANTASETTGGVCTNDATCVITYNTISSNATGTADSGGMRLNNGKARVRYNVFSANTSNNSGGGLSILGGTHDISSNAFIGNTCSLRGGAISIFGASSTVTISSNVFSGNTGVEGGAVRVAVGTATIANNTFYNNTGSSKGGGLYTMSSAVCTVVNNLFYGNKKGASTTAAGADYETANSTSNSNTFYNNALQLASSTYTTTATGTYHLGTAASGNVFAPTPDFQNTASIAGADGIYRTDDDGLRLKSTSALLQIGLNSGAGTLDILENTRIFNGTVDLGAYEYYDLTGFTIITGASQLVNADGQYTGLDGWTHYIHDVSNKYVLSVKKNGNNIGHIGEGSFAVSANTTSNWSATSALAIDEPYATNPSGWYVMNRWWNVTPTTQPSSDVSVRTYFSNTDILGLRATTGDNTLTASKIQFYKINSGDPALNVTDPHNNVTAASAYNTAGFWQYANGASATSSTWLSASFGSDYYAELVTASFSGGGGGGATAGGGAFPLEWLDFTARLVHTGTLPAAALTWTTADEYHVASLAVERSTDNRQWQEIAVLAPHNTPGTHTYTFTDEDIFLLPASESFYRINSTDADGQTNFSATASINTSEAVDVQAFPNPAHDQLILQLPFEGEAEVTLLNASGQAAGTWHASGGWISLDLTGLPAGLYGYHVWYGESHASGTVLKD